MLICICISLLARCDLSVPLLRAPQATQPSLATKTNPLLFYFFFFFSSWFYFKTLTTVVLQLKLQLTSLLLMMVTPLKRRVSVKTLIPPAPLPTLVHLPAPGVASPRVTSSARRLVPCILCYPLLPLPSVIFHPSPR